MLTAPNQTLPLEGKVIVITGAGNGIGREIAQTLFRNGALVIAGDIDIAEAQSAIDGLPGCRAAYFNPEDERSRRALVESTVSQFGRMDAIIDSAATLIAARH